MQFDFSGDLILGSRAFRPHRAAARDLFQTDLFALRAQCGRDARDPRERVESLCAGEAASTQQTS